MNIVQFWQDLAPKHKRNAVIGGALTAFVVVVMAFGPDSTQTKGSFIKKASKRTAMKSLLSDIDPRSVGMDALSANVAEMKKTMAGMENTLTDIKKSSKVTKDKDNEEKKELRRKIEELEKINQQSLRDQSSQFEKRLSKLQRDQRDAKQSVQSVSGELTDDHRVQTPPEPDSPIVADAVTAMRNFNKDPSFDYPVITPGSDRAVGGQTIQIRMIGEPRAEVDHRDLLRTRLPAGTILSGRIVTGINVPTGKQAKADPMPILIELNKNALLPNKFRSDIKGCTMLAAGYGELSTERAQFRGEVITCIRQNGEVIEVPIDSYVTGEDGKAGVAGRLVTKQGALLGRAMVAGFAEGLAGAFDVEPVPVIKNENSGTLDYAKVWNEDALQGAASKGASVAMERLADYYMDLAESMFPIIEINANRKVDIVVTKMTTLKVYDKDTKRRNQRQAKPVAKNTRQNKMGGRVLNMLRGE